MVGFFSLSANGYSATVGTTVIHVYSGATSATGDPRPCTCRQNAGFACWATTHLTDENRRVAENVDRRARQLERRAEFRDFVGHPVGSTVVLSHDQRREREATANLDWRRRALGKRPSCIALE